VVSGKVAVLLVEARPLKAAASSPFPNVTLVGEPHVLAVQPMLASFLKKNAKPEEAWRRGPTFEMTRGVAAITFESPKDWEYTRLGPEGSVIFMAPNEPGREFVVALQPPIPGAGAAMMRDVERMLVERTGGKVFADKALDGPAGGHEFIASKALPGDEKPMWTRRRTYERGGVVVSVLSKVPVDDVEAPPSEDVQKIVDAFFAKALVKS
jgi:hypothetical protein